MLKKEKKTIKIKKYLRRLLFIMMKENTKKVFSYLKSVNGE
jgi:hypothetical protein